MNLYLYIYKWNIKFVFCLKWFESNRWVVLNRKILVKAPQKKTLEMTLIFVGMFPNQNVFVQNDSISIDSWLAEVVHWLTELQQSRTSAPTRLRCQSQPFAFNGKLEWIYHLSATQFVQQNIDDDVIYIL